jgi:hypothetical protein
MGLMILFQLAGLVGNCQETPSFVLDKYIFNGSSGWGGGIQAVEFDNNRVYVGGDFTHVGPPTGNVAVINTKTGRLIAGFPDMMTGNVATSIPDGNGGWFVVTSEVGGDRYHILPNGKVNPKWGQYIDKPVYCMATHGDKVFIGGAFDVVEKSPRRGFAVVSKLDGSLDEWTPLTDSIVYSMTIDGDDLYVAGKTGESTIYKIHIPDRSIKTIISCPGYVRKILVKNNKLYFAWGLAFDSGSDDQLDVIDLSDDQTRYPIVLTNNRIRDFEIQEDKIFLCGRFSVINGQPRAGFASYDLKSGLILDLNLALKDQFFVDVSGIEIDGDRLVVGGQFKEAGGEKRNHLASFNIETGLIEPWDPVANRNVTTLSISGENLILGGKFSSVNAIDRGGLAAFSLNTGLLDPWAPQINGAVVDLNLSNGKLYAAGMFSIVNGTERNNLASFDLTQNGEMTSWAPKTNGEVTQVLPYGEKIYFCGKFNKVNAQSKRFLAAVDELGILIPWNPDPDKEVTALGINKGVLFAGGPFSKIGTSYRDHLAAFDVTDNTLLDRGLNPGLAGNNSVDVKQFAFDGDDLYAGGYIGDIPFWENRVVQLHWGTNSFESWSQTFDGRVNGLFSSGGQLYVFGAFQLFGKPGGGRRITRFDIPSGKLNGWAPEPNLYVEDVVIKDGLLMMGGAFYKVGGNNWAYGLAGYRVSPEKIQSFEMGNVSRSSIVVKWAPITGATHYTISASTGTNKSSNFFISTTTTNNEISLGKLESNQTYQLYLNSCNQGGCSSFVTVGSTTTPVAVPALKFSSLTSSSIRLSIDPNGNRFGTVYIVDRFLDGTTDFQTILTTTSLNVFIDGLEKSKSYSFSVRAVSVGGEYSDPTVISGVLASPSSPDFGEITDVSDSIVKGTWTASNSADRYLFFASTNSSPAPYLIALSTMVFSNEGSLSSLIPNTRYHFWVKACDQEACSDPKNIGNQTTLAAVPQLSFRREENRHVQLSVHNIRNPLGTNYSIEKSLNGIDFISLYSGPNPNVTLETTDAPIFVRAKAINEAGVFSRYSNTLQIDPPTIPPNAVRAYPVPVRADRGENRLVIEPVSSGTEIKIYTFDGRIVHATFAVSNKHEWDLTNNLGESVASGVYWVRLSGPDGKKSFRIVIQR